MSYTILYRSMFVKLRNNKYIPLVEIGSNNCYDSIGKRTRSWQQWLIEGREKEYSFTREEIMQAIESWIEREKKCHVNKPKHGNNTEYWTFKDIEKHFGYFGCCALYSRSFDNTSAQQVRNFFLKGFEQAVSTEEAGFRLKLWWYLPGKSCSTDSCCVTTEEELENQWQELLTSKGIRAWIDYDYNSELLWNSHSLKKKERTTGFVVTLNNNFITRTTARHLFHNPCQNYARVYFSRAAAERVQQRILLYNFTSEIIPVQKDAEGHWVDVA